MSLIPVTGIPSSYRTPGAYAEILFAQGPGTSSAGVRSVILVMPMTSTGTWTANTVYEVKNEGTANVGAGVGSPLHRACRAFLKRNKRAKLYALPYSASSGGSPVAATGTITYATTATAILTAEVDICGETTSTKIASGDTVTTTATNMAAAINAKDWLPVTAANVAGVLTLTAKIAGASQGTATIGVIRYRARIVGSGGTTVTTSGAFLGTGVAGADGTTTEAANLATALAVIAGARYYYIGTSLSDATSLGNLKTHIAAKSNPSPGLRSVGCSAWTGTSAAGITIAQGLNYERHQITWQKNSEHDYAEIVGAMLATRQAKEELDPTFNFDNYRGVEWQILPAYAQADWPTDDDANDAINGGLTPIQSDAAGSMITMTITTRSKNAAGTVADFRAAETHRISGADDYVDDTLTKYALNYGGKKLASDQLLSNGKVNTNQKQRPGVVTPFNFKPFMVKQIHDHVEKEQLQDEDAMVNSLQIVRDPNNTGRLEVGQEIRVIDLLHQATFRFAETSPG